MCYQKSLNQSEDNLTRYMDRTPYNPGEFEPYFLNDGFSHSSIYIIPQDEPEHWFPATWGLVPNWHRGTSDEFFRNRKYNTLNAKAESVFTSNSYRQPIHESRCLIFCDGFFEPHHYGKNSQPYFCYLSESKNYMDREIFTFAGIYNKDTEEKYTVSLLTVNANPLFESIHNDKKRMPLALDRKYELDWISDDQGESVIKGIMDEGFTTKSFKAHPVMNYRLKVNRELKNTEKVLEPVEAIDSDLQEVFN
ncbi:hypothetical protein C7S20_19210 [Christiangramia fulva]|uniref:Abasic site processing protein n=1 Tax=Christiangramia fulva TaxID=2126553 RepID=A0A2R3ZAC8_9FLAO|nr:SOS response-associated peptidase family protein [Christiangramia fulva]AVR47207.1 hypothetical protein C7S20_19210 [Christiangramia fulva]